MSDWKPLYRNVRSDSPTERDNAAQAIARKSAPWLFPPKEEIIAPSPAPVDFVAHDSAGDPP